MRKLIFKIEVTLDGFIGGPNGEMDWDRTLSQQKNIGRTSWNMLSNVDTPRHAHERFSVLTVIGFRPCYS